jgi:hypothetical protein
MALHNALYHDVTTCLHDTGYGEVESVDLGSLRECVRACMPVRVCAWVHVRVNE